MWTTPRIMTLSVVAMLPTSVSLVAPWGPPGADPPPVVSTSRTFALADVATVPSAAGLDAADGAQAREQAGGAPVAVGLATPPVAVPGDLAVIGVTWDGLDSSGTSVQYRSLEAGSWGAWDFVPLDEEHRPEPAEERAAERRLGGIRGGSDPVAIVGARQVQVRVITPAGQVPSGARLSVIDPGSSPADATAGAAPGSAMAAAQQPYVYTRRQWGADESLRDQSGPTYAEVKAAFVHHTVGTNSYAADQVPAIIRGIYDYHVRTQGWSDIGYNFLIDRFGRTWEGRYGGISKPVQGAHAAGVNDDAFGVSVMGNYHPPAGGSSSVPAAVTSALVALIGWKAQVHGFNPAGTSVLDGVTYPGVNGHRDALGNSTACPGDSLYATLPALRSGAGKLTSGASKFVDRWSGGDRYSTAATTSRSTFPEGAGIAFVATGADFPDALAGAPAGAVLKGPMLLTGRDVVPSVTYNELKRLNPRKVVILGGTGTVSESVRQKLVSGGFVVERWAQPDRYGTAATISARVFPGGAATVYIATAWDFPDALAGGPAGGTTRGPVLLTGRDRLAGATAKELTRLAPSKVVVLGGDAAVSAEVETEVEKVTGVNAERWSGSTRYGTAAAVSRKVHPGGSTVAFVTTGANFPDGLAGGPAGGVQGGPLLLTGRDSLPSATVDELKRLGAGRIVVLGGPGAVSATVETQLASYLR